MIRKLFPLVYLLCNFFAIPVFAQNIDKTDVSAYTLLIDGFDWGPAASKVIFSRRDSVSRVNASDYSVWVKRSTPCAELSPEQSSGKLRVLYGYPSDNQGNRLTKSNYVSLVLYAAPFEQLNTPMQYFGNDGTCRGNEWVDFRLTILDHQTHRVWNRESNRILPTADRFDLTGQFEHNGTRLTYASYQPDANGRKRPLLIWLHGGGEGGTDPSIALMANRAANYASPEMQSYFDGAHVLVPQSPTFWMDSGAGQYTWGEANDLYNESVFALIRDYVSRQSDVDQNRIYIGGCSNGGYMTLKLLLLHPDYFAAAFPSALAFRGENLSEADAMRIKHIPIWFIHSKDDTTTPGVATAEPVYQRLIKVGAPEVHFSYFDHVVDITNQFGGEDFHYPGHFSWIYSHTNRVQRNYDGQPVTMDGQPVSLMAWLARQRK